MSSYETITQSLLENQFLGDEAPKDSTVEGVLRRLSVVAIGCLGDQIGTPHLHNELEDTFSNIQTINQGRKAIDELGAKAADIQLRKCQDDEQILLTRQEEFKILFFSKGSEVAEKIQNSPIPKELLAQSPQTAKVITDLERGGQEISQDTEKALAVAELLELSSVVGYKKAFNNAEETVKKSLNVTPVTYEEMIMRKQQRTSVVQTKTPAQESPKL
jgi:hypothetical protein